MALTITPMRRRHLSSVMTIETVVYPRPWSQRLFEDELERPARAYVVARDGEQVVGYGGVLMIADDGHIATVAVDPKRAREGIGRALLRELVRQAIEMVAKQLTLEVRVSNSAAAALYREFGFVPAGARKAYYADNGEDAIVMWAHDICDESYSARLSEIDEKVGPIERVGFAGESDQTERHVVRPFSHPSRQSPHPAAATRETS